MHVNNFGISFLLLSVSLFIAPASFADRVDDKVDSLLNMTKKPDGVVFEIVGSDPDLLQTAIPRINEFAKKLRARFAGVDVAVVSHGREQFALQKKYRDGNKKVHDAVERLSRDENVPVHICQTFAAWNGVDPEDFPDYVTVSATGPQQIRDYMELGYIKIVITR